MPDPGAYDELVALSRSAAVLNSVASLLSWDQETYMPDGAAAARAEQQEMLAGLCHERRTDPRLGELISACERNGAASDPAVAAALREFRRDYDKATKLPRELVAELAKVGSQAQQVWKDARRTSDFPRFAPWLEKMLTLARRKAECYGWPDDGEPYDALLDEYEPAMRTAEIEAIFTPLAQRLATLIADLATGTPPDTSILSARVPAAKQHEFGLFVIRSIGFDLETGRLDTTTHPFCEGLAPGDTRLTTRYAEDHFTGALYGTLHEAGHGIYEQGLPKAEHYGTPLGEAVSLGIHESQSRMWENFVGRSREFWHWALPFARDTLGGALADATVEQLYRAVNTATPSFIRVEADEATYNLHIMIRFEIERALIKGDLKVNDVPGVWNEAYKRYLGLDVPDDRNGCLQDVHWSFGLMGYFPTYCLGNLYCAQLWEQIKRDIPDLPERIGHGDFAPLKDWLNKNVHAWGRRYPAKELCKRVTGEPLSAEPLLRHLEGKLRPIYGV